MPGYNHYPWCTCGWCVKYAHNRYVTSELLDYADRYSAQNFLERHGAARSITACFVNPNAKCPVCGASVFFYQNSFGSRVYFDELGPPWPKHLCTSKSTVLLPDAKPSVKKPKKRKRGLMLELLDAARKVCSRDVGIDPKQDQSTHWTLVLIEDVTRSGWRNVVTAEFIGSDEYKVIHFTFDSPKEMIRIGDIISLGNREISIFDTENMKPKRYNIMTSE